MVSRFDIIAGYYTYSKEIWNQLCEKTNVPGDTRLTLFGTVKYPDGKKASSNHYVWVAVANDLFTYDEGKYPNAVTTDAYGNEIELESPDGLVSWLCGHKSDYSGEKLSPNGTLSGNPDKGYDGTKRMLKAVLPIVFDAMGSLFKGIFAKIKDLIFNSVIC